MGVIHIPDLTYALIMACATENASEQQKFYDQSIKHIKIIYQRLKAEEPLSDETALALISFWVNPNHLNHYKQLKYTLTQLLMAEADDDDDEVDDIIDSVKEAAVKHIEQHPCKSMMKNHPFYLDYLESKTRHVKKEDGLHIAKLSAENNKFKNQISNYQEIINELNITITQYKSSIQELQSVLGRDRKKLLLLNNQIIKENIELRKTSFQYEKIIEELSTQLTSASHLNTSLCAESHHLMKRLTKVELELDALKPSPPISPIANSPVSITQCFQYDQFKDEENHNNNNISIEEGNGVVFKANGI